MCCICELIRQNIQRSLNFWLLSTLPFIIFIPLFSDLGLETSGRTWQNFRFWQVFRAMAEAFSWCSCESGKLFRIFCFTHRRREWEVCHHAGGSRFRSLHLTQVLENYSIFSFLEAKQPQPLLLHILQMYSLLVVGSLRNSWHQISQCWLIWYIHFLDNPGVFLGKVKKKKKKISDLK